MSMAVAPLEAIAQAERERLRLRKRRNQLPWREWLSRHFGAYTSAPFASRHLRYWEWVTALEPNVRPRPRVEVWPRGGAKSSTVELSMAYLGSAPEPRRHYVLYVSETQAQANKHVQAIATMLERVGIKRALNEYGTAKGWRHTEIRTANGFNVTAFGLDSGMRGVRLDQYRPDVIAFDDIDSRHDSAATTQKKIDVITTTVLPAGSSDCAVIVVQNKIAHDSIVSQLCDGRADFLHDRIPATIDPAIRDFAFAQVAQDDGTFRYAITGGEATWEGQGLDICAQQINEWGLSAFRREAQHEVDEFEGGLWERKRINDTRISDTQMIAGLRRTMKRIAIGVDPATTHGEQSNKTGIAAAGLGADDHAYVFAGYGLRATPDVWARSAIQLYLDLEADLITAESNQGGEMVRKVILDTARTMGVTVRVRLVHAHRGKRIRAEPVSALWEQGRGHIIGLLPELEDQLVRFTGEPADEDDIVDALVHAVVAVRGSGPRGVTKGI